MHNSIALYDPAVFEAVIINRDDNHIVMNKKAITE